MARLWDNKPVPVLFASCPEPALKKSIQLVRNYGGENCAGDRNDGLNRNLRRNNEKWQTAWKGKVDALINTNHFVMIQKRNATIWVVAMNGGPCCNWEKEYLRKVIIPNRQNLQLKEIRDFEALKLWMENTFGKIHPTNTPEETNKKTMTPETQKRIKENRKKAVMILKVKKRKISDIYYEEHTTDSQGNTWIDDGKVTGKNKFGILKNELTTTTILTSGNTSEEKKINTTTPEIQKNIEKNITEAVMKLKATQKKCKSHFTDSQGNTWIDDGKDTGKNKFGICTFEKIS